MARLHTHSKGQSGSKKPLSKSPPGWLAYKKEEIEAIIVKLAKQGKTSADIGRILRDSYGVPDVRQVLNKKIGKVLKDKDLTPKVPEDLASLRKREKLVKAHFDKNKKDMVTKRGLQLLRSKIRRLEKYFGISSKKKKVLI
tara:strand:- start:922 stop:1344 length:423 start_codon:yes stop_codon:yes gene_type:complete